MASFLFILKVPVEDDKHEVDVHKISESNANKELEEGKSSEGENKKGQSSPAKENVNECNKNPDSKKENISNDTVEPDTKETETVKEQDKIEEKELDQESSGDSLEWDFGDDVQQNEQHETSEQVNKKSEIINVKEGDSESQFSESKDKETNISPKKFDVTRVLTVEEVSIDESEEESSSDKIQQLDLSSSTTVDIADEFEGQKSKKKFDVKKVDSELETTTSAPDIPSLAENNTSLPVNKSTKSLSEKDNVSLTSYKKERSPSKTIEPAAKRNENDEKVDKNETSKHVEFQTQVSVPDEKELQHFIEKTTALEDVEYVLSIFDIGNYTVTKTKNGLFYQVMFVDEGGQRCEDLLNALTETGISVREGTSLGIYPSSIFKGKAVEEDTVENDVDEDRNYYEGEFRKSIKARLLVSQVVNVVQGNAEFKFDFLMLVITASIIAGLGLIESSSVILVASMLVSPLMGPILAGTFGFVIKNYSLRNLGIASEVKGLLICVLCGFIVGLIASSIAVHQGTLGGTESYPTDEMKSRGVLRGLIPGLLIAIASGVGVALSVLGGNAGSLVGVAISASLLPPAVNAGMLWAHSLVTVIKPVPVVMGEVGNSTNETLPSPVILDNPLNCTPFLDNTYDPVYSCQMEIESAYLGIISLSLTILNIICIFIMGIIFLKIKEVAPQTSTSDATRDFWKDDIKIARESYETMKGKKSLSFAADVKKLCEDMRKHKHQQGSEAEDSLDYEKDYAHLRELIEDVENDSSVQGIQKFIPGSNRSRPFSQQLGSPLFPGTPLHFHSNYFTYHGPATRTPQGFSRPTRMGSGITINSPKTEDSSDLETIDECTPFTNGTPTPKTAKFKGLLKPQSKLFRRRAKSFDVRDNKTSHPV